MDVAPVSDWREFWADAAARGPKIDGGYPFAVSNLHKVAAASDDVIAQARAEVNELCNDPIRLLGGPVKKAEPTVEQAVDNLAEGLGFPPELLLRGAQIPAISAKLSNVPKEVFETVTGITVSPHIVCLCGSTRFKEQFEQANRHYTLRGYIVLAPGVFGHADGIALSTAAKGALDRLHLQKIDMADEVVVVTQDGYIGESTQNEILYALRAGKPVRVEQTWPEQFK